MDENQSARRRRLPRREGSPVYEEEIPAQPTPMAIKVGHPPPVRVQVAIAGPPTQSSHKLHHHRPNASHTPAQQISTSDTRPAGLQTRPSHVAGHRGESRGKTETESHSGKRDHDSEPERHHPLATKKNGSSWGVNLFKGMAKSVATSAMNEVARDTKVIVNSSISNAFSAVGAPVNLQG